MLTPRALGLPYAGWRPGQPTAIRTSQFSPTPHTIINAPTGSGKTGIASAISRLDGRRCVVLTATLALQDVYAETAEWLVDLRGASHYKCLAAEHEFAAWFPVRRRSSIQCDDGPCHLGLACELKFDGCRYFDQRRAFVASFAGVTSYAAWLSNRRIGQPLGVADHLICDEAHNLIDQLMSACRVDVPAFLVEHQQPRGYKGWRHWALSLLEQLAKTADTDVRVKRERLERGLRLLSTMDDTWAWDKDERGWHFEPTVPRLLMPLLQSFEDGAQATYLSATITPGMLEVLDVDARDVTYYEMAHDFPLERRPIFVMRGARADVRTLRNRHIVGEWVDAMDDFMDLRDDRRGLVHCVSFDRGRVIYEASSQRRRMVLHTRRYSTQEILRVFRNAGDDAILVSPSIYQGHDFKYADAEFQVIPKLPFPDTTSNIMRARLRSTPRYRDIYTMTRLVQSCGRINRARDDSGETAIFDEHFHWWYPKNRDLAPRYFDEAIIRTRRRVLPLPKLAA